MLSAVAQIPHHTAATLNLSGEVHQQFPSILGLAGTHAYCDIWLLLTLVVGSVDERALHLMRPSPGTVDAGGSPGCQSIFHCRGSPMLSRLHMSHRALKLNVYAAPSPAHETRCSFGISLGKVLSNPMEARYCIAPKGCIHKYDVLAYVRPKPLLHSLDVPYARLFCVLLWFRANEDVLRF